MPVLHKQSFMPGNNLYVKTNTAPSLCLCTLEAGEISMVYKGQNSYPGSR